MNRGEADDIQTLMGVETPDLDFQGFAYEDGEIVIMALHKEGGLLMQFKQASDWTNYRDTQALNRQWKAQSEQ